MFWTNASRDMASGSVCSQSSGYTTTRPRLLRMSSSSKAAAVAASPALASTFRDARPEISAVSWIGISLSRFGSWAIASSACGGELHRPFVDTVVKRDPFVAEHVPENVFVGYVADPTGAAATKVQAAAGSDVLLDRFAVGSLNGRGVFGEHPYGRVLLELGHRPMGALFDAF